MRNALLTLILVACGTKAPEIAGYECAPRTSVSGALSVGVAHANGSYAQLKGAETFLEAGAARVEELNLRALKVMLTNDYEKRYPQAWPKGIHDLASLAATDEFKRVFSGPFETYSILTYTFALGVNDPWRSQPSPELLAAETAEIQALAEHLIATYAGTGKTFILHNWESDWPLRAGDVTDDATLKERAARMVDWLNARQAGVTAARKKMGERGVTVVHSIEVNKALASTVLRAVDLVLPYVCPDMVSYSAYEATDVRRHMPQAEAEAQIERDVSEAFATIKSKVPAGTPVYLSEFGFPEQDYENVKSTLDLTRLIEKVLTVSEKAGVKNAFYWQVFDNECTGAGTGCNGFWIVRPDGSLSIAAKTLQRFAAR